MTREEFEEMFDLVAYEKVRAKYHANDAFPHLYDKVSFFSELCSCNEIIRNYL